MHLPIRSTIASAALLALLAVTVTACSSGSATSTTGAGSPIASSAAGSDSGTSTSAASSASAGGGSASAELDACSLLSTAQASTLVGKQYSGSTSKTIARGQDQCDYTPSDNQSSNLTVIVYQPTSGVTLQMMSSVLGDSSDVTNVDGVGDKAIVGQIELDAQAGKRLVAVQGAGGKLTGDYSKAAAVAKAVIAALP